MLRVMPLGRRQQSLGRRAASVVFDC
jgi:hypothetical protein